MTIRSLFKFSTKFNDCQQRGATGIDRPAVAASRGSHLQLGLEALGASHIPREPHKAAIVVLIAILMQGVTSITTGGALTGRPRRSPHHRTLAHMVARQLHGHTVLADRARPVHATDRARLIAGHAPRTLLAVTTPTPSSRCCTSSAPSREVAITLDSGSFHLWLVAGL